MKKSLAILLALILALATFSGFAVAEAPAEIYAVDGEKTVIVDRDGITLTLSGDGEDWNNCVVVNLIVENKSGQKIDVLYGGSANGWDLGNMTYLVNNGLENDTKAKVHFSIMFSEVDFTTYAELETMKLVIEVRDENRKTLFTENPIIYFHADASAAAEAPAEESEAPEVGQEAAAEEVDPTESDAGEAVDAEIIDALLQGKWVYPSNGGSFTFAEGKVTLVSDQTLEGKYVVNTDDLTVDLTFPVAGGQNVVPHLPYTYADGELSTFNNKGEQLVKEAASEATAETSAEAASEPADEKYATLDVGSKGDAVKELQKYLIALGYLSGNADGIYGKGTAGGVKSFQAAEGLEETGTADSQTQERLFAKKLPKSR